MRIKSMFNRIKPTSKKAKSLVLVLLAIAFPAFSLAQAQTQVLMEGSTKSLNVTQGQTTYQKNTSALVDEVVQVEVWHHNRELPEAEKASNTQVKVNIPTAPGKTQIITGTTKADNANTVTDSTIVNLSMDKARVEYIPGTAKFRYNKGAAQGDESCKTGLAYPAERCYATVVVSDDVVNGANGANLDSYRGGPLNGCNAYHETVTVQVRVKADVVSVNKYVRHKGEDANAWKTSTTVKPGQDIEYLIRFKNEGNTQLNNVMVGDNMPKYNAYVNNTTMLRNGANPNGIAITNNNLTKGGINSGNYLPGAAGYVSFTARIDPITAYEKCGLYDVRNVGVVRPEGMNEFYNTAIVNIQVDCKDTPPPVVPAYACELLTVTQGTNRTATYTVKANATNGATIKNYVYDFGDGKTLTTDKNKVDYTYAKDGQYAARVKVQVAVGNETKVAESDKCAAAVNYTTPVTPASKSTVTPTTLPATGAGSTIALFVAVTAASSVAYYVVVRRASRI